MLDGSCLLSGPSGRQLAVSCASCAVGQGRESIGVEMKWNGDELMKMNWVYDGGGFVFCCRDVGVSLHFSNFEMRMEVY